MSPRNISKLLFYISLPLLLVFLVSISYSLYKLASYEKATGVITAIRMSKSHTSRLGSITYKFVTNEGKKISINTKLGISGAHAGMPVSVYYTPAAPESASMYTFTTFWLIPLISFLIAMFLGGIGLVGLKYNPA